MLFFYVDLHENKITKLIYHAIYHVQPKVLHFAKLSFWSSYSEFEQQQNLVQCRKLRLELLSTCKLFLSFVSFLLPIFIKNVRLVWHLNFWILDSNKGIGCC